MPSRAVVEDFVATIERGEFLEAIPKFYAEDMTAQENNLPPRVGRDAQVANETAALQRMHFDKIRVQSFLVDGDRVAIHYDFEMTLRDGSGRKLKMQEIAYQLWRGDRIVSERYFYDPAQRQPIAP